MRVIRQAVEPPIGCRRPRVVRRIVVALLVVLAGCSSTGRVEGPLLTSPRPGFGNGGDAALVSGTVVFDEATNCLTLELEGVRYPVVWPAGTRWQGDPPAVVLSGGDLAEPGASVEGGGGYYPVGQVFKVAGEAVATEAQRCIGPTDEVAFFNLGSRVDLVDG